MKVGDLVRYTYDDRADIGIVVKVLGQNHTMQMHMVEVLWEDGLVERSSWRYLEVINESR